MRASVVRSRLMADRCLLYYITDRTQFRCDEGTRRQLLLAKVSEAARAGVDYIQLREKDLSARKLEGLARDALAVMRNEAARGTENRGRRTRLLINSRTDVALAVGADGVHLRSDDVTPSEVRRILEGAHCVQVTGTFLLAPSCHEVSDVHRAEAEKADFAVFAPVFGKRG